MRSSPANVLTGEILRFLFENGIFAFRCNSTGIWDARKGIFRPAAKKGLPDILSILPPHGRLIGWEVKIGKDALRPEQKGFIKSAQLMGADVLVVRSLRDFLTQFEKLRFV